MPNWVDCKLSVSGPQVEVTRFREQAKSSIVEFDSQGKMIETSLDFDFSQFVPMPESLQITHGSLGIEGYMALYAGDQEIQNFLASTFWESKGVSNRVELLDFLRSNHPEAISLGKQYWQNEAKYGHKTWYSWAIENWGTKWNIGEATLLVRGRVLCYLFQTAWKPPIPLARKISVLFPTLTLRLWYDDPSLDLQAQLKIKAGQVARKGSFKKEG